MGLHHRASTVLLSILSAFVANNTLTGHVSKGHRASTAVLHGGNALALGASMLPVLPYTLVHSAGDNKHSNLKPQEPCSSCLVKEWLVDYGERHNKGSHINAVETAATVVLCVW